MSDLLPRGGGSRPHLAGIITIKSSKQWQHRRAQDSRYGLPNMEPSDKTLVSRYSAIGDTISCDAPYSAIGFRGKLFLRPPLLGLSLNCDRPF